ncbi:MAG TPA: NAD(P)-dependent oxidoreductase [Pyrinomonadaceae bacterium]|nr:NAD(P)-dependent oxidoreductase [Pyrinomonadaceae bacterium]
MSTHLVIGASGQVGEHLLRAASDAGFEAAGTHHSHPAHGTRPLDVRRPDEVTELVAGLRPAVVYLPASQTNVDRCESEPAEGYAVNVVGVRNVVRAANAVGARLVYFSSDYIFDGRAGPYREDDPANPVNEYGRQKLAAEHHVALNARDYLVVRTTVVYGWERQGKNFIYRLINTLKDGRALKAPSDQIGSPTYAPNLARAAVELAGAGAAGVYNVVGPERVSRYEFARAAADAFGLDAGLIQAVTTEELSQTAARPLNAGMLTDKAAAALTVRLKGYRDGLKEMASEGEG